MICRRGTLIDHPRIFVAANFAILLVVCSLVGIKGSIPVSILITTFVVAYNWKRSSINAVGMGILYSLLFDSDIYSFTTMNLRVWYLLLLGVYLGLAVRNARGTKGALSLRALVANIPVILLLGMSLVWLVVDNGEGRARNIKDWLFYVGLIYALYHEFKRVERKDLKRFLDYLLSLVVFVCLWGIFQLVMNTRGVGMRYMLNYSTIRPSAFFSETTWYAIYVLFGGFVLLLRYRLYGKRSLLLVLPLYAAGIFFSANRNAMIALGVVVALNVAFIILGGPILFRSTFRNGYLYIVLAASAVTLIAGWSLITIYAGLIASKFNVATDPSGVGRIIATQNSFQEIARSPVIGSGFAWYPDQVTSVGTFTGSKSFNLFFMIQYIFGLVGLVPFLGMLIWFFLERVLLYARTGDVLQKYGFLIVASFVSMSMFTPLHQHPIGMFAVALGTALGSVGSRWRETPAPTGKARVPFLNGT